MSELALNALSAPHRSLAIKARQAAVQGDTELARDLCQQILSAEPSCLEVRELLHAAQQKNFAGKGSSIAQKLTGWLPRRASSAKPATKATATFAEADAALAKDYRSKAAWTKLTIAADAAGLVETLLFAHRAVTALHPTDRDMALARAEALLTHRRAAEAVQAVKAARQHHPHDAKLDAMLQRAAVAQTVDQGNWEGEGSFRNKLRGQS